MILPVILTVEAAHLDDVNRVFAALGKGEGYISVACVGRDDATATHETPATHYFAQDMGAKDSDVAIWQAMCGGMLPGGVIWGQNGVITSLDAQTALAHMTVASEAGLDTPQKAENFLAGVLVGKNLKKRPEPDSAW